MAFKKFHFYNGYFLYIICKVNLIIGKMAEAIMSEQDDMSEAIFYTLINLGVIILLRVVPEIFFKF